jgi:hypothetical protein
LVPEARRKPARATSPAALNSCGHQSAGVIEAIVLTIPSST